MSGDREKRTTRMSDRKIRKPGPGRPKLPEGRARTKTIVVKVRESELELLKSRAQSGGLGISEFIRRTLFGEA